MIILVILALYVGTNISNLGAHTGVIISNPGAYSVVLFVISNPLCLRFQSQIEI